VFDAVRDLAGDEYTTPDEIAEALWVSRRTANRYLSLLVDSGHLVRIPAYRSSRGYGYRPAPLPQRETAA
jgi:Fic family protein